MQLRRLITSAIAMTAGLGLSACLAVDGDRTGEQQGETYLEPAGERASPDQPLRAQLPDDDGDPGDFVRPPQDLGGTFLEPAGERARAEEPLQARLPDDDDEPQPPEDIGDAFLVPDDTPRLNQPPGYDY